jgi:8-oxo-dGTP pyrophosphatase MutT (NUDIX family)
MAISTINNQPIKTQDNIICAGALFLARDTKRFLFVLRDHTRTAGSWGIVGGKVEPTDVTPYDAMLRESREELGFLPKIVKPVPLESYTSTDNHFNYNTYVIIVEHEFIPRLNQEHQGYAWVTVDSWPKPLHQGVKCTLINRTNRAKISTILDLI